MIEGMKMEEKGSTDSGSPATNSENSSPPVSGGYSSGGAGDVAVVVPPALKVNNGVAPGGEVAAVGTETAGGGIVVVAGPSGINSSVKRKRGRPRKYDENGNLTASYMRSAAVPPPPPGFYSTPPANVTGKRGRGRPAGSGNSQLIASMGDLYASTAGKDFTPRYIHVIPGEDIAEKVSSLVLEELRAVCVVSCNGPISNVTLRQPCSAGGTLTYEGRFELLSLTGSYTLLEKNGTYVRNGSLSASLATSDSRLFGGGIAGMLKAAGHIQLVVGIFDIIQTGNEQKKRKPYGPRSAPAHGHSAQALQALPISQAPPPNGHLFPSPPPPPPQPHVRAHGEGPSTSSYNPTIHASNVTARNGWNGAAYQMQHRAYPDMNASASMEE